MDKQTIGKILSAVVGLVLIGVGAWLASTEYEHAEALIAAGLAVLGGLGTVGLPRLREPRQEGGEGSRKRPTRIPPLPVLALALVSGCGASGLAAQADTAAVAGRLVAAADTVIVSTRAAELDEVRDDLVSACPSGCPEREDEYLGRAQAVIDRWAPVLACRDPVVEGLRSWIDAISLADIAASGDVALAHVLSEASRVVMLYDALRSCVASVGIDIPALPPIVMSLAAGGAQ